MRYGSISLKCSKYRPFKRHLSVSFIFSFSKNKFHLFCWGHSRHMFTLVKHQRYVFLWWSTWSNDFCRPSFVTFKGTSMYLYLMSFLFFFSRSVVIPLRLSPIIVLCSLRLARSSCPICFKYLFT